MCQCINESTIQMDVSGCSVGVQKNKETGSQFLLYNYRTLTDSMSAEVLS